MQIQLPDDIAAELSAAANAIGDDPQHFALGVLRQSLDRQRRLGVAIEPIADAFGASGLSEEEAVDLFEAEKHAMRQDRDPT